MALLWIGRLNGTGYMRLLRPDMPNEYLDMPGFRPTRSVYQGRGPLPSSDDITLVDGSSPEWASPLIGFIGFDADDMAWFAVQPNPSRTEYTAEVMIPGTQLSEESQLVLEVTLA